MATACPDEAGFSCANCGQLAGRVRFVTPADAVGQSSPVAQALTELDVMERPEQQGAVLVQTFFGATSRPVSAELVEPVSRALADTDAAALYRISYGYAPFHCPDCAGSYCGQHWDWREFDDGPFSGIEGNCPHGHFHVLAY